MALFFALLTALTVIVMYYDFSRYIIPNWLNALFAVLYPIFVLTCPVPVDWLKGLLGAVVVFAVGFGFFYKKWMGGGDVKLLTALALWVGFGMELLMFLLWVSVVGGGLSIMLVSLRKMVPLWYGRREKAPPRILQFSEPLPYGLAISVTFLYYLWTGMIPGLDVKTVLGGLL